MINIYHKFLCWHDDVWPPVIPYNNVHPCTPLLIHNGTVRTAAVGTNARASAGFDVGFDGWFDVGSEAVWGVIWCRMWCRICCIIWCRIWCRTWCMICCRIMCRVWCMIWCRMWCMNCSSFNMCLDVVMSHGSNYS